MTEEQKQGEPVNLNDIAIAVAAIDKASKAGAFDGQDLEIVGGTRNRLNALVQASQPKEQEPPVVDAEVVEETAAE